MSNINLIGNKDHVSAPPASRKLKTLRILAMVLLFGVSSMAVVLAILIAFSPLPQVQQQEQNERQTISQMHPEMAKIALIQDRMVGIDSILAQRNNYGDFLSSISTKLPADVTLYQISLSKKTAVLTVRSSSLEAVDLFLNNLVSSVNEKQDYSQVTLNSIVSDSESAFYSVTVSLTLL